MEGRVVREECLFSKKHRCPEASASRLSVTLCRATVFATYIPITRCRFVVCHAGTANVPRRHGRRAAPAWQTCRAGVANSKAPSAHSKVPWRNGFAPYQNERKWLRNSGGMCRISPRPPAACFPAPFSTPKSGEKRRCEVWDNRLRAQEACADGLAYTPPGHGGEGARRLAAVCEEAIGKRMRGR